jgi:hypothetical protein
MVRILLVPLARVVVCLAILVSRVADSRHSPCDSCGPLFIAAAEAETEAQLLGCCGVELI